MFWWVVQNLFDDLCCVERICIWSDRLRKTGDSNGTGESIQKRQFFSIILILVSDPSSVSPFFYDELLVPIVQFILSLCTEEKGGSAGRGLYHSLRIWYLRDWHSVRLCDRVEHLIYVYKISSLIALSNTKSEILLKLKELDSHDHNYLATKTPTLYSI